MKHYVVYIAGNNPVDLAASKGKRTAAMLASDAMDYDDFDREQIDELVNRGECTIFNPLTGNDIYTIKVRECDCHTIDNHFDD
jgi:hypothetical protein